MKIFTKPIIYFKAILFVLLFTSTFSQAQVQQAFTPRYNEAVNGDFTIIANNTISTTSTGNYNGNNDNHNFSNLVYVDIDGNTGIGATTFNSSSANFVNPSPSASCLTLKKVFLYWTAADREPGAIGTDNQPTWDFDDIKLMLPGETNYNDYDADEVIYRGRTTHFSNEPYICIKDITSEVNALTNPFGTYQVANVEGKIGSLYAHNDNLPTGVSGGWQIVFIYESPNLPLKNISIFDGYAHVEGVDSGDIVFNGFQTVPSGNVNANILIGALEGDRSLGGDALQIQDTSGNYVSLSTAQLPTIPIRSQTNFFNSRITIDNANFTNRNPASTNTLGFDAAVFELANPGNSIIANNQTSATFNLTSTLEIYGLYLLGLSVDVWKPELGPINVTLDTPNAPQNPGTVIGAEFNVENKGNDNAKNLRIFETLPPQLISTLPATGMVPVTHPSLPTGVTYTYNSTTNLLEFFVDDSLVTAGSSSFNVDFDLQIRNECYFLETNCTTNFEVQFEATYSGEINTTQQSTLSSATIDPCGSSIEDPVTINVIQPTVAWGTANNALDVTVECNDSAGLTAAQNMSPVTNKCNFTLTKTPGSFVPDASCSNAGTYTNTWNFTNACGTPIADFVQVITITDSNPPVISGTIAESTVEGCSASDATAPATTVAQLETLGLTITDCTTDDNLVVTSSDSASGTCPTVVTRTYTITDVCNNSSQATHTINVNDSTAPNIAGTITESTVEGCSATDATAAATSVSQLEVLGLTISDACTTDDNLVVTSSDSASGTCPTVVTRTYTITDACNNSSQATHTINVNDSTAPNIAGTITESTVEGCSATDATAAATSVSQLEALGLTISDACTTDDNLVVTSSDSASGTCPTVVTRTYTITDACNNSSQASHTINANDSTAPNIAGTIAESTVEGCTINDATAPATTVAQLEALGLNIEDNCTTDDNLVVTNSDSASGTCPLVVTRTYTITDACGNTVN
ncbi:hypothetical protein ACNG5D_15685, partial [Algibacter sp. PT7-4]